jgi:hypothetical protein
MRKILVVYSYTSKYGHGNGNVDFTINYDIPTIENIRDMERQIRESCGFDNVVVLNIIPLGESEYTE